MTITPLITRADAGAPPWEGIPALGTCSYEKYDRSMGLPVRITRMAPRGVALPNPRYTDQPHWPVARALIPDRAIFHVGLSGAEFQARYLSGLDAIAKQVYRNLLELAPAARALDAEFPTLVLLCFETDVKTDPLVCHRRMFAGWWTERTGQHVPELG